MGQIIYFLPLATFIMGLAMGILKPKKDDTPKAPPIICNACGCVFSFTANNVKSKPNIPYVECPICGTKHFFDSTSCIINNN